MSSQICIKTDKPLQQLVTEIRELFSLPPFRENSFAGASYYQFDMLGMLILLHWIEEDERDPEVIDYPYSLDLHMSFTEHELDTDTMEYCIQPYYAQLLAFRLGVTTAYQEKQKVGSHWQVRYCYCQKNVNWREAILYGEPGWEPAIKTLPLGPWRSMRPRL
jgi:hypothetical protein